MYPRIVDSLYICADAQVSNDANCKPSSYTGTSSIYCITSITNGKLFLSDHSTPSCTDQTTSGDILIKGDGSAINATGENSGYLINCAGSGEQCKQIKAEGYYYSSTLGLMKCVASTGICTKESSPADGYYIPSADDKTNKLYSYSSSTWTPKTSLEVGFYLSGADFDSVNSKYTKLIKCTTSTSCSFVTSTDIVINKFYINGDGASGTPVTYKSLIKCTAEDSCTNQPVTADGVYLDAQTPANVITCTYAESVASCTTNTGSTDDGKGYNDAGTTDKVIICDSSTSICSSITGNAKAAVAAAEGTPASPAHNTAFIDATSNKIIICNSSGCSAAAEIAGAQGQAYLDGKSYTESDKFTKLIKWKSDKVWEFVDEPSQTEAYIDAGSVSGSNYPNVIVYDATNKFVVKEGSNKSTGIAYIDATLKKNIIQCDGSTCTTSANTGSSSTNVTKFFIDGVNNVNIIKCTDAGADCTSSAGSTANNSKYYLDGINNGILECKNGADCTKGTEVTSDSYGYLDAGSGDKNVITCTAANTCSSVPNGNAQNAPQDGVVQNTGFLNAGETNADTTGELIICSTSSCYTDTITGAQGQALLDGKSYDATNQKFVALIKWDSSKWAYDAFSTKPGSGEAFIDIGSPLEEEYSNIIIYDTDKFVVKASVDKSNGKAYIDATDKTKIITCSDGNCTSDDSGADASNSKYFIEGVNDVNIITCNGTTCSSAAGSQQSDTEPKFYVDGINATNVIKCDKGASCVTNVGSKNPGYAYIDSLNNDSVIVCGDSCESRSSGSTFTEPKHYATFLNAGTTEPSKNLIICNAENNLCTTKVVGTETGNYTPVQGQVFFDGTSLNNSKFTKLIQCDVQSKTCSVITNPLVTTMGSVYIDGASDGLLNIIQCTSTGTGTTAVTTCSAIAGENQNGEYAYIDATQSKNIISCVSSNNQGCVSTLNTAGTTSTNADGETVTSDNEFYILGNDKTQIIVCTNEDGCMVKPGSNVKTVTKYYIDTNSNNNAKTNIIKCEGPEEATPTTLKECTSTGHNGSSDDVYYIDGNNTMKILACNSSSGCTSKNNLATQNQPTYYIDASGGASEPVIITCTTEACTSGEGNVDPGVAYLNVIDETKVITCATSNKCVSGAGYTAAADTYIDAGNNEQIIYCEENEDCHYISTSPRTGNSEYYARSLGTEIKEIIKCDVTNKCKSDKETVPKANAVFINALFTEDANANGDHENPLIICDKDAKCKPVSPEFTVPATEAEAEEQAQSRKRDTQQSGTKQVEEEQSATPIPNYYVNGDADSSQRIIKCAAEGKKCTTMNAADKNVYLNANYDATDNNKPLIKCTTNESVLNCAEVEETSSDENRTYYLNAGTSSKEDAVIECAASCGILEAKSGQIYINNNDTSQLISCSDTGCILKTSNASKEKNEIYLNSSDIDNKDVVHTNDLIICSKGDGENATVTCVPSDGVDNGVYLNADDKSKIIICLKDEECKYVSSDATALSPKYYVNGDPTNDSDEKLKNDLIKCKKVNNGVTCDVISGNHGDTYLNANTDDEANPLIVCTTDGGCIASTSDANNNDNLPVYYVNTGSGLADKKLNDTLIKCTMENDKVQCDIKRDAAVNQVYVNYGTNKSENQLIKCTVNACKTYSSNPTENNNEYYINSGDVDEASLTNDIIECVCAKEEGKETCSVTCTEMNSPGVGVYLNSNYSSVGDTNQLISCTNEDGCKGITSASDSKTTEYYVNAEATDLTNAIIFCSNKKCEKQTAVLNTYYVGVGEDPEINGLIECIKTEKEETTQTQTTQTQEGQAQQPAQVAGQNAKRGTVTEEKCKLNLSNSYQGYYLNAGSNKAINQVIVCDSSEGCKSEKVDLGYYVNAGDSTKPIIKCEKEGSECTADESPKCPADENATAGDYCYEEDQLKFFVSSNSTAIVATKSDDYYAFAEIASGNFPGIKTTTGSLFKISRYFINRFYKGGVVMIDKNGKLVDNLSSSDQSDISLYECNESTKLCTEKPGCTSNTYMFDSENGKAVFCNSGKLEYAEFTGYVIDSNRMVGTNHPYIIECQNNGAKCTSMKPKTSSYFENSGYDSTTNSLIECSNNNCSTVVADVGYYVGHEGEGIIQCTSSSSCTYSVMKNKSVKYVNAGSNKTSKAIIECSKNKCSAAKAKIGYYMTYSNTILIQCTSPSNCVEFTPTVNYYDNADSSESSNSIINCAQSSQVITCAPEATNNGFYMSSSPNVLIRCKSGSKCKTVVVKNGIFRGALKGLSSSNKRSDEEDIELEEGDGKSVAMPRDSDEAYGIIRCVAGKCSALSPSEVASIPVCEFNNNKCYITLEYSMTKSATTSISAGNICTNADRSVFYFATDTIVVKPNVISGVTATYVYTTTNSNCLEVNDSYTDMYFTVGSNIFTLDQGSVLQFYETGYYFINTNKNTLVSGNDIDAYNDENVKLYKCNGSSCSITDKPDSLTYYVDVNKRIFKYNINNDAYSFAYDKDIMCIFANNKCTPNADLKNKEFCITYKGELALVKQDIKNRETGECYKASSITNTIYGYSQYLYNMNMFSAEMVDETGYYIISLSTNTTVVSKNYKTKNNNLVVYGCQLSSCKEYTPDEDTYYYDARAKNILRYKDGIWSSPSTSGYAYISIDPATTYIYRFTKNLDEIKINGIANYGYYYTVDGEMYHCDRDEDGECTPIDSSGYYFTNAGEVYYCVHDSENIEPTECTKQACVSGQYYYIDEAYYRCESSSSLVPVMSRYCSYNDNVIINFPLALTEEFPEKIKQAIEGVEKNNNSTAIVSRRGKNYLESVSGVFTNCTYNVEETKSTFDLVCVNNYVSIDENTDDVKICSMEQLGYVECIEDEENPEKCNVSGAFPMVRPALFTIIMLAFSLLLLNQF